MWPGITQNWTVRKPLARTRGALLTTQCGRAGEAALRLLGEAGNAVDVAVAAGLALAAAEPWNSGLGGVGFMLVYSAREQRTEVVDFGPISPRHLDPASYPLVGGTSSELFGWPAVLENRNARGPLAFAVPGQVDGMATALARFGTRTWREVLAPAIELAAEGVPVDWFTTLKTSITARELSRYPSTRAVWLPEDLPPVTPAGAPLRHLELPGLERTLRRLADHGPRDFYEGALAGDIVADIRAAGGVMTAEDLAGYRARVLPALEVGYRDSVIALAPGLTAGPSMKQAFEALAGHRFARGRPDAQSFVAYASVLRDAYAARLQAEGASPEARAPGCTSHINVVDGEGNMVSLQQTLLSAFGSCYVLPTTGILMNNAIMWFDPEPGKPNSLGAGRKPLTNMSPLIATRGGKAWLAAGGSGGRKVFPALLQLCSMLIDHGLTLEEACHWPRIDASGGLFVSVDTRHPPEVKQALAERFPIHESELLVLPNNFACPAAILIEEPGGERTGLGDVMSPWSAAVAQSVPEEETIL